MTSSVEEINNYQDKAGKTVKNGRRLQDDQNKLISIVVQVLLHK
jgi:hypothetical protein